jgi:hypothetical protein
LRCTKVHGLPDRRWLCRGYRRGPLDWRRSRTFAVPSLWGSKGKVSLLTKISTAWRWGSANSLMLLPPSSSTRSAWLRPPRSWGFAPRQYRALAGTAGALRRHRI